MKKVVLLAFVLLLSSMPMLGTRLAIAGDPTIHHVYPGQLIQNAINSAQSGDTIIVHAGTYYEHVVVNKTVSLIGENITAVIDGNGTGDVIHITTEHVNVTGFTIRNGTNGIFIQKSEKSDYNIINGNIVTDNLYGIHLYSISCPCDLRHDNIIINNIIKNNDKGIFLGRAEDNVIYHNSFMNNTQQVGIYYSGYVNVWDGGYPSGGNYWSDYEERYPDANELDGSGIWDTPYVIDEKNRDRYPLMNPLVQFSPIAGFSYSPEFPLLGETITFNASVSQDPDGSIVEYKWNFSDGNVTTVDNPIITHVYTAAGTYTVNLTVTDNDGLTGSIIKPITIKKESSSITINVDPATVLAGSNVTINGTIIPLRADVNVTISYKLSNVVVWDMLATVKTDSNSHYNYTWETTDGGIYEIKASWLGDENTWPAESETKNVTVTLPDSTPPTTTINLSSVEGNNDWFTSDVTVTLSATDYISGVEETGYSFDNATWATYTMPFNITAEGTTVVYYNSTDRAGNVEAVKAETIKIDKTVPSGSININNGDAYTILTSVRLTLTASDATSDVHQVRYSNDGVWDTETWETPSSTKAWALTSGDGAKTVYYQVKDRAGLVSMYQDTITLDTTPPTISITSPDEGAEIRSSSPTITWNGTDATSGIDHYEIRLYGGSWINVGTNTTYTFAGLGDGRRTVEVKAFDKAGYSQVVSVNFTVNTSQIGGGGPEYTEGLAIIGVIVILVALATAAYLLKVGRKS